MGVELTPEGFVALVSAASGVGVLVGLTLFVFTLFYPSDRGDDI
jgi:hypothetical protein